MSELAVKLKKAAEKAGADEWCSFVDIKSKTYAVHTPGDTRCGDVVKWPGFDGQKNAKAKATFIALANPANILALLAEREADKARIDELIAQQDTTRKSDNLADIATLTPAQLLEAAPLVAQFETKAGQQLFAAMSDSIRQLLDERRNRG